ncbi:Undefined function [Listeria monocytogenes N53-1]|nr:Undefined function [Listeria monocytogenes N53-1]
MTELEEIGININSIENTEQIISQLMDNYSDDVLHLVFSYVKKNDSGGFNARDIY